MSLRHRHQLAGAEQGFTLIELILVIVITGILSVGAFTFIHNLATGYQLTAARSQLAASGWNLMTRLQTELRQAWPGSLRLVRSANAQCLEFVPVAGEVMGRDAAGRWLWSPSPTVIAAVGSSPTLWLAGAAQVPSEVYRPAPVAKRWQVLAEQLTGRSMVAHARSASPSADEAGNAAGWRYLVGAPVSFCLLADGRLFRYQDYGWHSAQPLPDGALSLATTPQQGARQLLARGLLVQDQPFVWLPGGGAKQTGAQGVEPDIRVEPLLQLQLRLQNGAAGDDPPLQLNRTLRLSYALSYVPDFAPAASSFPGGGL